MEKGVLPTRGITRFFPGRKPDWRWEGGGKEKIRHG